MKWARGHCVPTLVELPRTVTDPDLASLFAFIGNLGLRACCLSRVSGEVGPVPAVRPVSAEGHDAVHSPANTKSSPFSTQMVTRMPRACRTTGGSP